MQAKQEFITEGESTSIKTLKTPIFDIDDLSFLRFYGLGLRHVALEHGIREAKEGEIGRAHV